MRGTFIIVLFIISFKLLADVPNKNVAEIHVNNETIFVEFEAYNLELRQDFCYYNHIGDYVGEAEQMIRERIELRFASYKPTIKGYKELIIVPVNVKKEGGWNLYVTREMRLLNKDEIDGLVLEKVHKGNTYGIQMYDRRLSEDVLNNLQRWDVVYQEDHGFCEMVFVGNSNTNAAGYTKLAKKLLEIPDPRDNPERKEDFEAIHDQLKELGVSAIAFCSC